MTPQEILDKVRELIAQHAGADQDEWWYTNRFVFARLMLDERHTKTTVKERLFALTSPCSHCGEPFSERKGVHLHRLDNLRGYSRENCVLVHQDCHEKLHRLQPPKSRAPRGRRSGTEKRPTPVAGNGVRQRGRRREFKGSADSVLVKRSRPYGGSFLYWWDISPGLAEDLSSYEAVEFVCEDTGASCTVPVPELKRFLIPERQTSRGTGNWGIKVKKGRADELAFEPGERGQEWLFLPVVWMNEREED